MKKKDIISKVLDTANKLTKADGIPLDICDDLRKCIEMVQEINSIELVTFLIGCIVGNPIKYIPNVYSSLFDIYILL